MKQIMVAMIASALFGAGGMLPGIGRAQEMTQIVPRFAVIDVGTVGGSTSIAESTNNVGQVAGVADTAIDTHIFRTRGRTTTDVTPGAPTGVDVFGLSINLFGQVAGNENLPTPAQQFPYFCQYGNPLDVCHAILTAPTGSTGFTDVGTLGGESSMAFGVNDSGEVAGVSLTNQDDPAFPGTPEERAFVWRHGAMQALPFLGGGTDSSALAINDAHQMAGWSAFSLTPDANFPDFGPDYHAVRWSSGVPQDLGTLPGATLGDSSGTAINRLGDVVGFSESNVPDPNDAACGQPTDYPEFHATVWIGSHIRDLAAASEFQDSEAFGVNTSGEVVGLSATFSQYCGGPDDATLWTNYGLGQTVDLNQAIPPNSGWTLVQATGVNDRGQIVGWGFHRGEMHGFVLVPSGRGPLNPQAAASRITTGHSGASGAARLAQGRFAMPWDIMPPKPSDSSFRLRTRAASGDELR